ncbi:MAG: hypothetical protein PHV42_02575 [Candidatus Pacebacteria bacterium]|nr:hypothetical protein [Candidatus Paceibacterota bacterium]
MKKYVSVALGLGALMCLVFAVPAFADTSTPPTQPGWAEHGSRGGMMGMRPAVFGIVSAVSGNTITVTGRQFGPRGAGTPGGAPVPATTVTYTVDATNAKITKNNTVGTIGSLVVGDTVAVQGTVNGTSVTATMIRDGVMMRGKGFGKEGQASTTRQTAPQIQGNGEPVIAGTVSSVSGETITITNKSNTSYTIDATNAKIYQGQNTITISNVNAGDSVIAQGTINGTSVTASTIIDHKQQTNTPDTNQGQGNSQAQHPSFWGRIGNFFRNLF